MITLFMNWKKRRRVSLFLTVEKKLRALVTVSIKIVYYCYLYYYVYDDDYDYDLCICDFCDFLFLF